MDNAMNALWRAQQDAATRAAEGWLGLLQPGADQAPQTPAPPSAADDQEQAPQESGTSDEPAAPDDTIQEVGVEPAPREVIEAIQNLGNGQREFAEHMTRWAELQRDLADTMTAWASRQGEYADALERLLGPSKLNP